MNWFWELLTNPYLITALSAWFLAQIIKTILYAVMNGGLSLERLFGDGGMPSGHSATVTSLAVFCALMHGTGSHEFAVSAILAIIVCHDAMGVRFETGKQAQMINEIIRTVEVLSKQDLPEVKLKELVGHTPIQVLAGITIGICNAAMFYYWIL